MCQETIGTELERHTLDPLYYTERADQGFLGMSAWLMSYRHGIRASERAWTLFVLGCSLHAHRYYGVYMINGSPGRHVDSIVCERMAGDIKRCDELVSRF